MISNRFRRWARIATVIGAAAATTTGTLIAAAPAASASSAAPAVACSDVEALFARGTGEAPGLGITGGPFVSSLTSAAAGRSVSVYAVNYAAAADQSSSGAGSTDLVNHLSTTAAACPSTKFVLGGYSQGATVVTKAVGVRTFTGGTGSVIPAALSSKVAAVVVFGNPLGLQRQTIETASATYGARAKSFCNTGDPVCGGGFNFAAHLQYASNGSTTLGARFAAARLG